MAMCSKWNHFCFVTYEIFTYLPTCWPEFELIIVLLFTWPFKDYYFFNPLIYQPPSTQRHSINLFGYWLPIIMVTKINIYVYNIRPRFLFTKDIKNTLLTHLGSKYTFFSILIFSLHYAIVFLWYYLKLAQK